MYLRLEEGERRSVRDEVNAELSGFVEGNKLRLNVEMLICHGQADPADDKPPQQPGVGLAAPIDPRLEELLVCPKTKEALDYNTSANELISRPAGVAFPIRDGIPIMLLDSARALDQGGNLRPAAANKSCMSGIGPSRRIEMPRDLGR